VTIDRATIIRLQAWTAKAWADVVDAPEYERRLQVGTSVEVPRVGGAVSRYIAKYASKVADGDGTERPMGRWWGTFGGASAIPYTLPDDYQLTEAEGHAIRRTMERWLQAKRRHRATVTGRRIKGQAPRPRASRRIFTDNPSQWLRVLDLLRQPSQVIAGSRAVPRRSRSVRTVQRGDLVHLPNRAHTPNCGSTTDPPRRHLPDVGIRTPKVV